jgi:hypothetical protein
MGPVAVKDPQSDGADSGTHLPAHTPVIARRGESVVQVVIPDLRRLARYYTAQERPDHILQPTAVVHEAYLTLVPAREQDWQNR